MLNTWICPRAKSTRNVKEQRSGLDAFMGGLLDVKNQERVVLDDVIVVGSSQGPCGQRLCLPIKCNLRLHPYQQACPLDFMWLTLQEGAHRTASQPCN